MEIGDSGDKTTHSDLFVFCPSCQVHSVRAETHASNVQISIFIHAVILQFGHLIAGPNVEYLCRAIASSGYVSAIVTKSNTANDTLMDEVVNEVDIENPSDIRIEDCIPIVSLTLLV